MTRRIERVDELLREELSEMIQRELKDPRLDQMITITEVSTSPDLRYAKVYVSVLTTSDEDKKRALEGLKAASGFIHRELVRRLKMRQVPELAFVRDDSLERGAHLTQLIKEVTQEGR